MNFYKFKILARNLFTGKKYTLVNIIGLSTGLCISLLMLLYIRYETSFDRFNPNADSIYRIVSRNLQDGTIGAATPIALSDVLKSDFPEIDKACCIIRTWDDVKVNDKRFDNLNGSIVEKDFFSLFNFPIQQGNQQELFTSPYEVVITKSAGVKLFGTSNPLGKTLEYKGHLFTVTGVINNIPSNSIFNFDYFLADDFRHISYPDLNERWYEFGMFTFVTFHGNAKPKDFEKKLATIEPRYYPDFMKNRSKYMILPFKGSHLNPDLQGDLTNAVSPVYLWILGLVALGILVIGCLNFVNISMASTKQRNLATGIKKVNGATSKSLILGFLSEISLVVFISFLIAITEVYLLLPAFNMLVEKNMAIDFADPVLWIGIVGFCLVTILLSGLYPSIVLSRPSSVKLLLQKNISVGKLNFQKGFVVFQFTLTIVLTITLFFVFKQVRFMQNHDIGFNKKDMIAIPVRSVGNSGWERMEKTNLLVDELEKYQAQQGFGKASVTEFVPGFGFRNLFKIYADDSPYSNGLELLSCDIDENFLETYDMHIIKGRFFSNDYATDYDAVLLNETAWEKLKWDKLEGKEIGLFTKDNPKKVVGVVNDINVQSLQYPVMPMIYQFGRHHDYPGYVSLRLNPQNKEASIDFIKQTWTNLFPDIPFTYESIENKFMSAYGDEKRMAKITGIFTLLAMSLSLLGIFALSAMQSEKRIKEIGVRRVNGARISEIINLLNVDFTKWILVAFIIAAPLAWFTLFHLLSNFAYKVNLSWWGFALAGCLAMVVALLTVSFQSWKKASKNPVDSLRYE